MDVQPLLVGSEVIVRRAKPARGDLVYAMTVESDDGDHIVVAGPYSGSASRDLGYVRFDPADHFVEHSWRSRWFMIADVRDPIRGRKGWYCDVTRPAEGRARLHRLHRPRAKSLCRGALQRGLAIGPSSAFGASERLTARGRPEGYIAAAGGPGVTTDEGKKR